MKMKLSIFLSCFALAALQIFLLLLPAKSHAIPTPTAPPPATTTAPVITSTITPSGNYSERIVVINGTTMEAPTERMGKSALKDEPIIKEVTSKTNGVLEDTPITLTAKPYNDGHHPIQRLEDATTEKDSESKKHDQSVDGKKSEFEFPDVSRLKPLKATEPPLSHEDRNIRKIWGGTCTLEMWNLCSRIRSWGGDYLVPDKNNPSKLVVKSHKIDCAEKPEKSFCLRNGWTVARCHMLCMSQCNLEYRQNYDKLVLHEGECKNPILGKK